MILIEEALPVKSSFQIRSFRVVDTSPVTELPVDGVVGNTAAV